MKTKQPQTGYTLIELLLYVSMIGILLGGVTTFFATAVEARVKNQSISEVNDQGVYIMELMTQTIRNATDVTVPAVGATGSSLTLTVPTGSLSPTVFSLNGSTLQIKEGTAAAVPITNSKVAITALTFKNLSRSGTQGIIQINMTLERVNTTGRNEYEYERTFTTSVSLRQ